MHFVFLNQVHAGHRPAHTWFLKIDPYQSSVMCVCVSAPEAINNKWRDMDSIQLVKQVYSCYNMAIVVIIVNGHGLGIDMHHSH